MMTPQTACVPPSVSQRDPDTAALRTNPTIARYSQRNAKGFSLAELMVAITIGLIILTAVGRIFVTSRSSYVYEEGMARVQESGRFAMDFITQDVRMAGYTGCLNKATTVTNNLKDPTFYVSNYVLGQYLTGHTYTGTGGSALADWTPALPGTDANGIVYFSANEVVPYTDVLTIRRGSELSVRPDGPMSPDSSAAIGITGNNGGLSRYDIVLVSDCKRADIFQITGPASFGAGTNNLVHNTGVGIPGNLTQALSFEYGTDAEIMKFITRLYYISRRGGNVTTNTNPPALFRKEFTSGAFVSQELVEGVENMKVVFGEDTDNDKVANQFKRANSVGTWGNVVSTRFGLLVQTTTNVDAANDTKTYPVAGTNLGPFNDKRRRHVYSSTIQIRNP
jgi:type IV pilus assembly protein PilW